MQEKMLAGVFESVGKFAVKEVPVPTITGDDDVLLRVEAASICGTDVHILADPPGFIAGPNTILSHEYIGRVEATGPSVSHIKTNDRVVVEPNIPCGFCVYCRMGLGNQCENVVTLGVHIDGGFAQYNLAPARMLHKISSSLPGPVATLTEPLSCVLGGTAKLDVRPGDTAVVLGAGPIGLLFLQMIRVAGAAKVMVSEPSALRRNHAMKLKADIVINPKEEDLAEKVRMETEIGADVVVDTVGSVFGEALKSVKRGGTVLLFGVNQNASEPIKQFPITRYDIRILGSYVGNYMFPQAIQILENRLIEAEKLITHKLPLVKLFEGIELMRRGEGIKIVIEPWKIE